jgi:hypothetical protein
VAHDVELDAQRGQRGEDVAEHDDAVRAERAPGLQAELRRDLRILRPLPEGQPLRVPAQGVDLRERLSLQLLCVHARPKATVTRPVAVLWPQSNAPAFQFC